MTKLSNEELDALDQAIVRLAGDVALDPRDAERLFGEILAPLLRLEGYALKSKGGPGDRGIDFEAINGIGAAETIGIQTKFYRQQRRVPTSEVRALIGAAILQNLGRVLLVANTEFSRQAQEEVSRSLPLRIELIDILGLRRWVTRLRNEMPEIEAEVRVILQNVSRKLAQMIAFAPNALAHLEWRDVERVVAEVFDGLGFAVTLTPGSKDGGKDVILTCKVNGKRAEYYVEIKHWRSSTRVGSAAVEKLLKVIAREKKDGGLFLSTYGFTENAFEQLTTIERQTLKFGDQEKIVALCQSYVKARAGLWSPPLNLSEIIFVDKAEVGPNSD